MKVYFVGAGPGDPDLLTVKAKRLLENCDCCLWAGSLINPAIVQLAPSTARLHDSACLNLDEIVAILKSSVERSQITVRLHTGDPSIYGAIAEQMNRLDQLGIDYEVVPGVSSFQAAAAALKSELTVPWLNQTVILSRVAGRTPVPEKQNLSALAGTGSTLCLFLSADKVELICRELIPFYGPLCPAALVYRASWPDEKIFKATLSDLAKKIESSNIKKTALIMVGPSLDRHPDRLSLLYDSAFSHQYRQGSADS